MFTSTLFRFPHSPRLPLLCALVLTACPALVKDAAAESFFGFELGAERAAAERVADASPRMAPRPAGSYAPGGDWTTLRYTGNNHFRDARQTELVFRDGRLYEVRISFRPSRDAALRRFEALTKEVGAKVGRLSSGAATRAGDLRTAALGPAAAGECGMYVSLALRRDHSVQVAATHKATKDAISGDRAGQTGFPGDSLFPSR